MLLSPKSTAALTFAISSIVFLVSVSSQFWLGKAPCLLCFITRYCFLSIALLSAASLWKRKFRWISLAAVFLCFSFSFYHLGVENHWWAAPQSCAAELPTLDKLETIETLDNSKVYCDRANWLIFGISSTLWSFVIAAFLFWFSSLSYAVNYYLRRLEDDD